MSLRRELVTVVSVAAALLAATAAQAGNRPFMPLGESVAPPPGYTDLCQRGEASCGATEVAAISAGLAATSALATSSIGGAAAPHAEAPNVADAAGHGVQSTMLQAYRPAIDSRFVAAGEGLNASSNAEAAPVAMEVARPALLQSAQMRLVNNINREVNHDVQKATDFDLYGLLEYWSLPRVIDGKMYGDCEDYALEKRRRLIAAGVPASAMSMAVAVTARGETHAVLVVSFQSGDWVLDNLTPWATPWEDLNYRWVQRQVAGSSTWAAVS